MAISSFKIGSIFLMAMSVYALVISLLWISITEVMFVSDFLAFTGQSLPNALASGSSSAELWLITKKIWGIELLLASLLMIFITAKSLSKAEKWSWYALLIGGTIFWGSLIGYKLIIGYFNLTMSSMTFIVGAILFAIGVLMTFKPIFMKKPT